MEEASLVPALTRDLDQLVKFSLEDTSADEPKAASDNPEDDDEDYDEPVLSVMDDSSVGRKLTRVTFRSSFAEKYATELHEFHARCSMATDAEGGPVRDDLPRFDMLFDVVLDAIFSVGATEELVTGSNPVDIRLILIEESRGALMTELGKALAEASRILDAAHVPSYTRKAAKHLAARRAASGHTVVLVSGGHPSSPVEIRRDAGSAPPSGGSAPPDAAPDATVDYWPTTGGGVHASGHAGISSLPFSPRSHPTAAPAVPHDIAQIRRDLDELKAKAPPAAVAAQAEPAPTPSSLETVDQGQLSAAVTRLMGHAEGRAHITSDTASAIARQRLALSAIVVAQYESSTGGGADAWALIDALRPLITNYAVLDASFLVSIAHPARMAMDELALIYSSPLAPETLRRPVMEIFSHLNSLLRVTPEVVTFRPLTAAEEHQVIKRIALQREGRLQLGRGLVRCALAKASGGAPAGRDVVYDECVCAAAVILTASDYSAETRTRLLDQIRRLAAPTGALDGHRLWERGGELMDFMREAGHTEAEARRALKVWQQDEDDCDEGLTLDDVERQTLRALVAPYRWYCLDNQDFLALTSFEHGTRRLCLRRSCGRDGVVTYSLSDFYGLVGQGRLQPLAGASDISLVRRRCRRLADYTPLPAE